VEHFSSLARAAARDGWRVLVLSGPAERTSGETLARELAGEARVAHWIGQRGLRALASLFAAAGAAGARLVACDSGPLHVAESVGLAALALAGPQDPLRTGPFDCAQRRPRGALRSPNAPDCAPCLSRRCSHPRGRVCLQELPPELVLQALER
jgi:ADP-heptose:LPS heptosyltransferase